MWRRDKALEVGNSMAGHTCVLMSHVVRMVTMDTTTPACIMCIMSISNISLLEFESFRMHSSS